ncbi:MAG TPA: DUF4266 domain-containing protein [Fibrobacteria bacterium]|nr:DUF4266 domain-containing protein [Fibrobacteria bacterium]
MRHRIPFFPASLLVGLSLTGCAAVRPWEREALASPCMQSPFAKTALEAEYQDKIVQTTTGGGLPGDAPGGGCGCAQ